MAPRVIPIDSTICPERVRVKLSAAELGERLRLDLADPFPGQPQAAADVVQGLRLAAAETEAQTDDLPLARRQLLERAYVENLKPRRY